MTDELEEIRERADRQKQRAQRPAEPPDESVNVGDVEDEREDDPRRYRLGIANIDRSHGPLRPGGLTTIAALSGYGKTSLAEIGARDNATEFTVFFATLEMMEAELQANLIGREMGVDLETFERERRLRTADYLKAVEAVRSLNLRLWRPPVGRAASMADIFKRAARVSADIIYVDYTKYLEGWSPGNEASKIVGYIAAQAKHTGIHVVLLAQLKFEGIGRRPTLDHMEDTKRLTHDATSVLLIHRPFAGDKVRDVVAEIAAAKNRKGKMFRAHTHWYGPTHSFYTMDESEEAEAACCKKKPPSPTNGKTKRALRDIPTLAQSSSDGSWPTERDDDEDLGDPASLFPN